MSAAPARVQEHVSGGLDGRIATYLAAFWPELPPKHIRMNATGAKYSWAKNGEGKDAPYIPLTYNDLVAHAAGERTIGAHLHDSTGRCRVGMLDIDAGGRVALLAALAAAHELGYHAYGIYYPKGNRAGAEHDGGRLVVMFADYAPWRDVRALLGQIRAAAGLPETTEIWPGGGNAVALPFCVHIRKQTRGELLTQHGKVVDLDTDLAAGFDLLLSLPQNSAPPSLSTVVERAPDASSASGASTKKERKISLGELSAEQASLADVRARFNREHTLEQLLAEWGATPAPGGYSCPCGVPHAHQTTLFISRLGRLFSYSPRCKLYSTKGYDAFGFYVKTQHGDDSARALKALNPIGGRSNSESVRNLPEYITPDQAESRRKDRERKRQARQAAAQRLREDVLGRAAIDETMPDRAHTMLDIHLTIAGQRGWHRASVARMAALAQYGERWVQRANQYLVENGYLSRSQPNPTQTAVWTLQLGTNFRDSTPQTTNNRVIASEQERSDRSPVLEHESYSCSDSRACEAGAIPQPDDYAELDDAALEGEAARLEGLLAAAEGSAPGRLPQVANSATVADLPDLGGGWIGFADGAAWRAKMPKFLEFGGSPGRANFAHEAAEADTDARPIGLSIEYETPSPPVRLLARPVRLPPARRAAPREISASDRYRLELAGMKETDLAGELKKHQRTLAKHAGAHWLPQIRAKLELVQAEIDARELVRCVPDTAARPAARRSAILGVPRIATAAQLQLELVPP